jgi:hypothetical protein
MLQTLWYVGIPSDNHVRFRGRPAKTVPAGCACWVPGGVFCVAASWLAGWPAGGRNWGPEKGRRISSFR